MLAEYFCQDHKGYKFWLLVFFLKIIVVLRAMNILFKDHERETYFSASVGCKEQCPGKQSWFFKKNVQDKNPRQLSRKTMRDYKIFSRTFKVTTLDAGRKISRITIVSYEVRGQPWMFLAKCPLKYFQGHKQGFFEQIFGWTLREQMCILANFFYEPSMP